MRLGVTHDDTVRSGVTPDTGLQPLVGDGALC
jgi:hypothetical protein